MSNKTSLADSMKQSKSPPVLGEPDRVRVDHARPSRTGKKAMVVRVSPGAHRAMRLLALDEDSSLQALLEEAVNDLLLKYRRPPVV